MTERLEPGDLVVVDLARPSRWISGPSRVTDVAFPRPLLPLPAASHPGEPSDDLAN